MYSNVDRMRNRKEGGKNCSFSSLQRLLSLDIALTPDALYQTEQLDSETFCLFPDIPTLRLNFIDFQKFRHRTAP